MEFLTLRRHQIRVATCAGLSIPRLCCVLRLSQPLDVFFHPKPLGLVSCRYHPGFRLQSLPLRVSLVRLSTPSAPPAVSRCDLTISPSQLQGFMQPRSPYLPARCYPMAGGRSSPDVHPFEVFLSRSWPPCGCLLSWASARRRPSSEAFARRRACSAEFQRTEECPTSFEAISLPGIFSPASSTTEVASSSGLPLATLLSANRRR